VFLPSFKTLLKQISDDISSVPGQFLVDCLSEQFAFQCTSIGDNRLLLINESCETLSLMRSECWTKTNSLVAFSRFAHNNVDTNDHSISEAVVLKSIEILSTFCVHLFQQISINCQLSSCSSQSFSENELGGDTATIKEFFNFRLNCSIRKDYNDELDFFRIDIRSYCVAIAFGVSVVWKLYPLRIFNFDSETSTSLAEHFD